MRSSRLFTAGGLLLLCGALAASNCNCFLFPPIGGDPAQRAISGLEIYSQRGCGACHCNDAVGGCNLDAPPLMGTARQKLDENLRGDQVAYPHPLKIGLSDTQLEDLGYFLESLRPGSEIAGNSLVTQGYNLYIKGGCISCHLSSGQGVNQGGLGVAIAGTDPDNIYNALAGRVPCHPRQRNVPANPSAECRYDITTNPTVQLLTDTPPPDQDDERVRLSYFLSFIAPPPTSGVVEPCNGGSGEICTIAGNGASGFSKDGIPATQALIFSPLELSLTDWNADGVLDLVFVDWNNHRIRVVYIDTTIDGVPNRIESIAGTGKVTGSDALNHPTDLSFDATGALVMANWHNQNIYRYAKGLIDGSQRDQLAGLCDLICSPDSPTATSVSSTFIALPTSVTIHPDGRIFFSEGGCSRIRILTVGATKVTQQPSQCITAVNLYPDGLIETFAGRGGMNGYSGDGGPASAALFNIDNSPLNPNFGIAFSPETPPQRLYVCDTRNHCIRYIDMTANPPTIHLFAGVPKSAGYKDGAASESQFSFPANVYVHTDGFVYVADTRNHAIRRISPADGSVKTVAGNGTRGFNGDNRAATDAQLDNPGGIDIHPDGRMFIADLGNNRVRVVNP